MDGFMFLALSTIALVLIGLSQKKPVKAGGLYRKSDSASGMNREKSLK